MNLVNKINFNSWFTWLTLLLTLSLGACGGGGSSSTGAANTTVVGQSSVFYTATDTSIEGTLQASDSNGGALTFKILTQGTLGSASLIDAQSGSFKYVPNPGVQGTDIFTFQASLAANNAVSTDVIPVTIHIQTPTANTGSPPNAANDAISIFANTSVDIAVLANDIDTTDAIDPTSISIATGPANGVAVPKSNGTITYTPNQTYTGTDTFTYTVADVGGAVSNSAQVTVIVQPVVPTNNPPVAKNDAFQETEGSVNNILAVLADNGSGPDSDPDGDTLTITGVGAPSKGGSVSINAAHNALLYTAPAGFFGTETFRYTISDGHGGTSTATVTVNSSLTDDFSGGMASWQTVDDDGGVASSWTVIGGALQELNSYAALDQSYHKGTYAYFTGGDSFTDYRFSVDTQYLGTGLADDVGIMFRYRDNNNYYRLSMNSRYGFTRLEKKVGGTFTPLAVNARGYSAGELLHFTVDANGSLIQIMVNGDPLFAINDSSLLSGSIALYTQGRASFDNVVVQGVASAPTVTLAAPVADTVTPGNSLSASAIATNVPPGGSVEFLLDGATSIIDNTFPYIGTFNNVPQGDHTVAAIIRDAANVSVAQDTNTLLGVQGDYYVAIGDSITNGDGDNYAADNQTNRMVGFEGYEANLSTLLENSLNIPVIVYNEGIGGDESVDAAFSRVASILARHPDSNKVLVLLGTNDALANIPSGQGCSGAACNGTYKGNMQALLNTLAAANKQAWVARVPPVFGYSSPFGNPAAASVNTSFVQSYNTVINTELSNLQPGPDLYSYFLGAGQNRYSLFANVLHPNGLGHMIIASLWYNVLNPAAPVALPFVLDNLAPSTVSPYIKQNLLETGNTYYVDNAYTLEAIPPELAGGRWIMTDSAGVNNAASNYISFDIDRAATVYIAYDAGAGALPNWMNGYANTGLTLSTSDPLSPTLNLYSHAYSAGHVVLGGNLASGASGANSNYVAIVVPN